MDNSYIDYINGNKYVLSRNRYLWSSNSEVLENVKRK